jgi:hypothetical protein
MLLHISEKKPVLNELVFQYVERVSGDHKHKHIITTIHGAKRKNNKQGPQRECHYHSGQMTRG